LYIRVEIAVLLEHGAEAEKTPYAMVFGTKA
jgi:hypothetical protein